MNALALVLAQGTDPGIAGGATPGYLAGPVTPGRWAGN